MSDIDLRALRLGRGMTQQELADASGVPQPNISAFEAGRRSPSRAARERLTAALRPRPSEALAGKRDAVRAIVEKHGGSHVRVFGSTARGSDRIDSDLDLLIDVGPTTTLFDLVDMEDELEVLLGVRVDVVHDWGPSPILAAARADAVAL